ncbi:hypothetical protein ACE1TI_03630 [Alteribacillus sp. JSM 102045]|uniref:hypothetical protein n=1 Tax=Alteribacillus sp. JSM 102045 TaxID=1562101 RepID=UPI0035C0B3F2
MQRRIRFFENLYKEAGCGERGQKHISYLKKALQRNKNQAIKAEILPLKSFFQNLKIIEMPGHADDQAAFYDKKKDWLFGDLLINHISSNALIEPDLNGHRTTPLLDHIKSMKKAVELQPELIFSGHGSLIKKPEVLVKKRLDGINNKAAALLQLIKNGEITANSLAQSYYEKKYEKLFPLVMSKVIGHLDYLEATTQVKKELINGIWNYRPS